MPKDPVSFYGTAISSQRSIFIDEYVVVYFCVDLTKSLCGGDTNARYTPKKSSTLAAYVIFNNLKSLIGKR